MTRRTAIGAIAGGLATLRSGRIGAVQAQTAPIFRNTVSSNANWKFFLGDPAGASSLSFDDSSWTVLNLPHDWSIALPFAAGNPSGQAGGFSTAGIGWYRLWFNPPAIYNSERLLIYFEGIYGNSTIWFNGSQIGAQTYGFSSMQFDLTALLTPGMNLIAVRVDNSRQPNLRWYSGSGIYRNVWLTTASSLRVDLYGVSITTPTASAASTNIIVRTTVINQQSADASCSVATNIYDPNDVLVASATDSVTVPSNGTASLQQTIVLATPQLWSPDNPNLYQATTGISLPSGPAVDGVTTPFGVRTFRFDPNQGFFLNGIGMKLQGVSIHHDGGAVGAAVPVQVWERRLTALKGIGCNAIRLAHNPQAPELLDLLDQMGFLAIGEAFDKWDLGYAPQFELPDFASDWQNWLLTMLLRDRNHPSIVLWSVGDEPGPPGTAAFDAQLTQMVDFVHANEPTRPVLCALVPQINGTVADIAQSVAASSEIMDIMSVNYQEQFYDTFHSTAPDRPIIGTETYPYYRGVPNGYDTSNPWFDCASRPYVAGHFVWAGVDYLGESAGWPSKGWPNALIDTMGRPKPSAFFFQSVWSASPMVHAYVLDPALNVDPGLQPWSWPASVEHWNFQPPHRGELIVQVQTPSNCDSVMLFVNGRSYGEQQPAAFPNLLPVWNVLYVPGTLTVLGLNGGNVVASFTLKTAGRAAAIALQPDETSLSAQLLDVCHVDVSIVDDAGVVVPNADRLIGFSINGPANLIGVDNGDLRSPESYQGSSRSTYLGRALAVIQSNGTPGAVTLQASADGLTASTVTLNFD
jgi:beta-galactosidase